jgi:hypothetical protein
MCRMVGNRIYQPACEDWHEKIGHRSREHGRRHRRDEPRLASPMAEEERQNVTHCMIVL